MSETSWLVTFCAVALLAGCASPDGITSESAPVDATRLTVDETTKGVAKDAPWPSQDWWTGLQDDQLNRLIGEGIQNSPTLKVARARIRKAAAVAGLARSRLYPQVDGSMSATDGRFTRNGLYPYPLGGRTRSSDEAELSGSFDPDIWGGHEQAFRAALGGLRASEVDAQAARLELSAAIARTYVDLAAAYDQEDIDRDLLRQKKEIQALSARLTGAGLVSEIENRQAEAAIAATEAEMASREEHIALLKQDLAVLVGASPDRGTEISRPALHLSSPLGLPSDLPADLIGRRPDIVAQRWRIEAAGHTVEAARADFYPNINLKALVGLQSIGIDRFMRGSSGIYGAGAAITLPIFDAGRLRSNLAEESARLDIEIEQYNAAVLAALREVVGQLTSWQANQTSMEREHLAVGRLDDAYRLAVLRYREGLTSYLTVLSAEGELIDQRRKEADSKNRQYTLTIALNQALGGGFVPRPLP
ncbi:MAG: efflux transporter outer membrane subunit [Telmatospirillum sp.]|nr:efflux transporter outer membrane subunit [Telmatospirillum sp.]